MADLGSALLSIPAATDATQGITRALQLKDLMSDEQMKQLSLNQAEQQASDSAQIKSAAKGLDLTKPTDMATYTQRVSQLGHPDVAISLLSDYQKLQSGQTAADEAKVKLQGAQMDLQNQFLGQVGTGASALLQTMDSSKDPAQGFAMARAQLPGIVQSALQGLPQGQPWADNVRKQLVGFLSNAKIQNDPQAFRSALVNEIAMTQQGQAHLAAQQKASQDEKRLDIEAKRADVSEQQGSERLNLERQRLAQSGAKAPAGFEWDPKNQGQLIPIPGGPKDPASSNMSGRQAVYFTRVASAGNEAALAIKNIAGLPTGASTGIFGVGASPGHSLFASAKGALTNTLSSQNVQDYNTMLAGIKRNLATIESAGMAPGGSMTDSMGSLELRPGDTGLTKLRKMAEMRQIIERGLEVNLSDPRVPEPQKALVRKITQEVSSAVPYTQQDVTDLEDAQAKNPKMTLSDLMKQKGLAGAQGGVQPGGGGGTPAAGAQPQQPAAPAGGAPKRIASDADYNSLPSGTVFVGPDGKTRRKP